MKTFDVSGCRADVVKPTVLLSNYTANHKVFAICNASLYNMTTREPCGTIVENGVYVHNEGNGYGCGVVTKEMEFGSPWEKKWNQYLTGYNSPVQGSKYTAPAFNDSYVFNTRNTRIGIGRKQGKVYIVTDDNVTLKEFANNAIKLGFDTLVNLDGGGSRHLYYNGTTVYKSYRIPYNAIVFYKDDVIVVPSTGQSQTGTRVLIEGCPYIEPKVNVRLWSSGNNAKWVQWYLKEHGYYTGSIDGLFWSGSTNALKKFQKDKKLDVDGICGPKTREELKYKMVT